MPPSKPRDPKGTGLYTSVRSSISTGKLQPGECLPSARELQNKYRISYRATLAALDRLAREGLVVRKQGSGTFVADTPGRIGGKGQGRIVRIVASFTSHFTEMFLDPLLDAVQEELNELGCRHSTLSLRREGSWNQKEWVKRIEEAAEAGEADVVLQVYPTHHPLLPPPTRPTVFVAQDMETVWAKAHGYDVVTVDARQSGVVAAQYLKKLGCKRIAMVGVRYSQGHLSPYTIQRFQGFEQVRDAPIPKDLIFTGKTHTPAGGAEVMPRIMALDPLPDAVFAATDDLAHGLCHALLAHGIKPGKDIKVIGCDGQPPLFPQDPNLTTVAAPLLEMGKAAARMALQRAENPDGVTHRVLLNCTIRKGDTA